jgi:hypothetical protein
MTFSNPYIFYMQWSIYPLLSITHSVAIGNECNCGTIEYVWSELTGTTGIGNDGLVYFTPNSTRTENYLPIGSSSGGA